MTQKSAKIYVDMMKLHASLGRNATSGTPQKIPDIVKTFKETLDAYADAVFTEHNITENPGQKHLPFTGNLHDLY